MNRQRPETETEELADLGEARLVCRVSRKTVVWGLLLASVLCVLGITLLFFVLEMLLDNWTRHLSDSLILLALAVLLLWGGKALWRKTNRLRSVRAVVHTGGLSYHNGNTCFTCPWDQIEDVGWRVVNHYEESTLTVGGGVPIPGTTTRDFSHTSHRVTVRRKDGVTVVFTDELENLAELAEAIQEATDLQKIAELAQAFQDAIDPNT